MDAVEDRRRLPPGCVVARRVHKRVCRALGFAIPCGEHAVSCIDKGPHQVGPRRRRGVGGLVVMMFDRGNLDRWGEPRPILIDRLAPCGFESLVDKRCQRRIIDSCRRTGRDPPVHGNAKPHRFELLSNVLMDERVGEPGQERNARHGDHLHFGAVADESQDVIGKVVAHPRTPTRTFVNRAGAAECPVCATCIGWPFPQFGVPQWIHSSPPARRSSEPQNTGPMPV